MSSNVILVVMDSVLYFKYYSTIGAAFSVKYPFWGTLKPKKLFSIVSVFMDVYTELRLANGPIFMKFGIR